VAAALAQAGSPLADFSTLKMEAIRSSETSVHTKSTRRYILEDDTIQFNFSLYQSTLSHVSLEVLKAMMIPKILSSVVSPCSVVIEIRSYGGICHLNFNFQSADSMFF
jgi:hypothetical protein